MGQRKLGRYRILGELGRGAMGVVYRAADPVIEREVALKTLLPDLPADVIDEIRIRFLREARSAGRLSHPNIVTIFDVGQEAGLAYIAMELLEGRSLQQMLKDPERIPFHTAADIIAQVAEALEHAHKFSIVHRDVKPANVVVAPSGLAKLTDFGVAYVPASNVTQTGSALGSPRYMAPEQVLGQPIDSRTDLFSLGVVLYEVLTKRTPFEWPGDTTVFALMQRIAGEPHPPLRQIDPQIPAGFDRIMDRALAKRPQDRYQKAAEMASDLRNYHSLGGGTEFAKTVPLPVLPSSAVAAEEQKVRNQLIDDLEQFAKNFGAHEEEHLREEEQARLKKEQAWRDWGAIEEQKRESFERAEPGTDPASLSTTRRMEAVEIMRQQSARKQEQAKAKTRAMAELDSAMRTAYQYLTEFGKEMNTHAPHAGKPYEFIYIGRLASVTLTQATVDNRTLKLTASKELCARIRFHYRVKPAEPPKIMLLGEDVARCEQYLKSLRVAYQVRANTEGRERPTLFVVTGLLPCEINIRADYEASTATVELINVRRFGRVTVRFPTDALKGVIDDLARYVIGVDNDFSQLLAKV
ncbi:MAG: serine/threonine protein kinase [Betaproteobacteria bacterium]|nr:MAG: serine/threonine protein kinase [Betaproteobacteria bacterium]